MMRYHNLELHNIRAVFERAEGGVALCRVPEKILPHLNSSAQQAAFHGSGCEIRFNLEGDAVTLLLQRGDPQRCDPSGVAEVWFGPFQASYELCPRMIGQEPTAITIRYPEYLDRLVQLANAQHLPFDPRLVRVLLPYDIPTYLLDIDGAVSPPRPEQLPSRTYLAYGSSITHGSSSVSPADSYAMRVARGLGYDLLNLGMAGSAQLDFVLAEFFADELNWDIASCELGINVLKLWSAAEFREKVQAFLPRLAQAHPERPIVCTDVFSCAFDLEAHPELPGYRAAVRETVAALQLPRLIYVDGRDLLPNMADLSTDLVHPAASGMQAIATNFLKHMQGLL